MCLGPVTSKNSWSTLDSWYGQHLFNLIPQRWFPERHSIQLNNTKINQIDGCWRKIALIISISWMHLDLIASLTVIFSGFLFNATAGKSPRLTDKQAYNWSINSRIPQTSIVVYGKLIAEVIVPRPCDKFELFTSVPFVTIIGASLTEITSLHPWRSLIRQRENGAEESEWKQCTQIPPFTGHYWPAIELFLRCVELMTAEWCHGYGHIAQISIVCVLFIFTEAKLF